MSSDVSGNAANPDEVFLANVNSLDEAQRRVIQEIADGIRRGERRPLRVLACAGAGKTKTMVTGVAAIVRENYLPANDVIMTTFTKAATGEMRTRLGGMLRLGAVAGVEYEERGQRRWSRGGVNVTTYHSLALRRVLALVQTMPALRRPHGWATALNLDVKDRFREAKTAAPPAGVSPDQLQQVANVDLETLWERIVSRGEIPGLPKNTPPVQEKFKGSGLDPKSVATVIEVYRAHGATTSAEARTLKTLAAIDDQHAYAFDLYNAVKRALPAWDFADVLQAYHDVVRGGADRVRFLVVDECFPGDTPILLADGTTRAIRDIVEGDAPVDVLTWDPETKAQVVRSVVGVKKTMLQKRMVRLVAKLRVPYPGRPGKTMVQRRVLVATEDHRIFRWDGSEVRMADVVPGDKLHFESTAPQVSTFANKYKHGNQGKAKLAAGLRTRVMPDGSRRRRGGIIVQRGGNGRGLTVPQEALLAELGEAWTPDYAIPTGHVRDGSGYPTAYKVDLAKPGCKIAIELDGESHRSLDRKAQDQKKTELLTQLGWQVHRYQNVDAVRRAPQIAAEFQAAECPIPVEVETVDHDYQIKDYYVYDLSIEGTHRYYANGFLVHNCQDNNPVQMAIARFLTRNHPQGRVVYVGDVRQSIYGFRGADPSILAKADLPEDQGGENAITLELATNYRSTGPVVACGNRVVHSEPWSVGSPARAARPDLGHVEFFSEPGPVSRARRIAEDIAERLSNGAKPSDFAVLSRKRSAMGPLEVFFLAKNIPVKIQGGSPFFRIKVIQRIMGILRLANAADLRNVVQRPIESILKADFYRLFRDFVPGRFRRASVEDVFTAAVRSPATIVNDLADWFDGETSKRYGRALLWSKEPDGARPMEEGFEALLRALGEAKGSDPKAVVWAVVRELHGAGLAEIPDFDPENPAVPATPEMPEGDVAATVAAATSGESDREMVAALAEVAMSVGNVASICALSLKDQLKDVEEDTKGTAADVESAKVDDANRVVVSTIHASKGLEYPTVYLFAGAKEIPANPEADRAEELRILYVGVTRARNRLVVCTDGGSTPWMDRLRPPEGEPDPDPKPEPEAEVPAAPTGPGVDTINAMPEVQPEPVVEADPLLDDFLRLRKVIGEQHPDLLPAFDALRPDVLRAMALVRDEAARQREREAKAEGTAAPPEDVEGAESEAAPEAPTAPAAPEAPETQTRVVDTVMTGRCFVQVRHDRNVHGGPVTPVDKIKPVQIPEGTPVVCERDGAFTVGYVSAAAPAGWAETKAWTKSESNKALAEIGPYLDQLTERWLRRIPVGLRDDVKAAALWSMAAGGASIRKAGMRYTAGANNELPGSWRRVIDDLTARGLLQEHSTKTTTEWSWAV